MVGDDEHVWTDKAAYEAAAKKPVREFQENFEAKYPDIPEHKKSGAHN